MPEPGPPLLRPRSSPLRGNLREARAHWVRRDTLLWNVIGSLQHAYILHYDPLGRIKLENGILLGGKQIRLELERSGPGGELQERFPHLRGFTSLKISPEDLGKVPKILKGQIVLSLWDPWGNLVEVTTLQIPGVLDDLYAYNSPLGVTYAGDTPTLRLWAPTAKAVALHLFEDSMSPKSAVLPMEETASGVWCITGNPDWTGKFYLYEVRVYAPGIGRVVRNLVNDPYSLSLSTNSLRSQIVNLEDSRLKPGGWDKLKKPSLEAFEDLAIYELHVRDFSASDESVPLERRGTYLAFTEARSNGMKHLKALRKAGLTHIHLLPVFDFASAEEDRSKWKTADREKLKALPPNSEEQQNLLGKIRGLDGYNWGYDPLHYTVPEGSYAVQPDGSDRIPEFRQMVQALNQAGLRVVMDVVYNHTVASGQNPKSVLDRIVPGYYHRLTENGEVATSTCCNNTATEHLMMEKLMIDSLVTWATAYKIDGFRFDLMGHHMRANMAHVRAALDSLSLEKDGVDGKKIYLYGEGWDFGEVANNARGVNASQLNMAGLGIGVFNDRLRDAARGNSFNGPQVQGFITGLYFDPNATDQGPPEAQKARLLHETDWIRIGLAGGLRDYALVNAGGETVIGRWIDYNGKPTGYCLDPQENVNYISAHDNETLFDVIQLKAPGHLSLTDRVRMQNLGIDLVMLAQGVPFFHAGVDLLRSKSLDRNSFSSGDWYNRLDFTYASNNWGVGLPPAGDNRWNWPILAPLLGNPSLKPGRAEILKTAAHFREMLQIRKSSRLFRLETAEQVAARLSFLNVGPGQIPGLIVMSLRDLPSQRLDPRFEWVVVLFNATPEEQPFSLEASKGRAFELHPLQIISEDPLVRRSRFDAHSGTFRVPGRTTGVFVRGNEE